MRFFELPIIDDLQKEIFVRSALFTGISRLYHVHGFWAVIDQKWPNLGPKSKIVS